MADPGMAEQRQLLQQHYPSLAVKDLLDDIHRTGVAMHLERGGTICELGQHCTHLALILRGQARVFELAESGREITLYRVGTGECCILTASCIMSGKTFPAIATCEEDLDVLLVPAARVEEFMLRFAEWRQFVWSLLADRLSGVLLLLEEVTFRRLDERIMRYLLGQREARESNDLKITHQTIADDLGTSREVVSRVLKEIELSGTLSLSRGHIIIEKPQQLLQALALCD